MVVMATAVMVVTLYDDVGMGREPPRVARASSDARREPRARQRPTSDMDFVQWARIRRVHATSRTTYSSMWNASAESSPPFLQPRVRPWHRLLAFVKSPGLSPIVSSPRCGMVEVVIAVVPPPPHVVAPLFVAPRFDVIRVVFRINPCPTRRVQVVVTVAPACAPHALRCHLCGPPPTHPPKPQTITATTNGKVQVGTSPRASALCHLLILALPLSAIRHYRTFGS